MRTLTSLLVVLGLTVLSSPDFAAATPAVAFKAKAVPVAGFPHTGNIAGAGAVLETEFKITGHEYGGFELPLIGLKMFLPSGVKLHLAGLPTCPNRLIEAKEPERCPKGSSAGPPGKLEGFVVFGTERVPETVSLEPFYAPGRGLNVAVLGRTPASIAIVSSGRYLNLNGSGGFGPEAQLDIPLVETVPGAAVASSTRFVFKLGSAARIGHKTRYSTTMPKRCPNRHVKFKAELTFAENGDPATPLTVSKTFDAPCPQRSRRS